jgi:hypothetical protein
MRQENRIMIPIPSDVRVDMGFRDIFGEWYSPADLIVENLNSAGLEYIRMGHINIRPWGRLDAKLFRDDDDEANIVVTDKCILVKKDNVVEPIMERYDCLRIKDISSFLGRLILKNINYDRTRNMDRC